MGALILFLQSTPAPTSSPLDGVLTGIFTTANILRIEKIVGDLIDAFSKGVSSNPWAIVTASAAFLALVISIGWFVLTKLKAAEIAAAQAQSDADYQNQIDNRVPQNNQDNQDDNKNWDDLDKMK